MAAVIGKPVRVIKRCDRSRVVTLLPSPELQTAAQQQREIVSVVMSWVRDKTAKAIPSQCFCFETKEEGLEPEHGSLVNRRRQETDNEQEQQ